MEPITLNQKQKAIVTAYALTCHPHVDNRKDPDLNYLMNSQIIHREQDHITDRGAAYAMTQCGMSFSDFIARHKWERRLGFIIENAKVNGFNSKELLDLFFREKYRLLLKYDAFQDSGAESLPMNLAEMTAELCINLLNYEQVPLKNVQGWFAQFDDSGTFKAVKSKEEMKGLLKSYLNSSLENQDLAVRRS